ncbi:unnamed protein product [Clonostachys rhizophaga]|uniref:Uncharacterized protein n=1 Tax=Clonostachys rhizophaga TaxID=160324 RepID=A0A9N9V041_9HYPO|nr:unnamed protein product [Clonostachys rhizophaga]
MHTLGTAQIRIAHAQRFMAFCPVALTPLGLRHGQLEVRCLRSVDVQFDVFGGTASDLPSLLREVGAMVKEKRSRRKSQSIPTGSGDSILSDSDIDLEAEALVREVRRRLERDTVSNFICDRHLPAALSGDDVQDYVLSNAGYLYTALLYIYCGIQALPISSPEVQDVVNGLVWCSQNMKRSVGFSPRVLLVTPLFTAGLCAVGTARADVKAALEDIGNLVGMPHIPTTLSILEGVWATFDGNAENEDVWSYFDRPLFVGLGRRKSRIPRFITILDHPYVKEYQRAIESLSDPVQFFCYPESQLGALLPPIPDDIFKKLSLENNRWAHTVEILSSFVDCPLAIEKLEELNVKISSSSPSKYHKPSAKAYPIFTRLLKEAVQLKTLAWMDPYPEFDSHDVTSALHKYLADQKLNLPSVTTLILGPNAEFFVSAAPNLQKISSAPGFAWLGRGFNWLHRYEKGPQRRLVRSLSPAKQLEDVELRFSFNRDSIADLVKAAPGMKRLLLEELSDGDQQYEEIGYEDLKSIILELAKLESLTVLRLPYVNSLGISSFPDPGKGCGHAYSTLGGTKLARIHLLHETRETEEAADIILQSLPQLTKLCIKECADVKAGKIVRWPWTGRLRDHILESWPRHNWMDSEDDVKEDPDGPVLYSWEEDEEWFPTSKEHSIDEL